MIIEEALSHGTCLYRYTENRYKCLQMHVRVALSIYSFPIYIVVITIFIFIIIIIIIFLLGIENIHTNVSTDNLGMVGLRLNFSQTLYSFRACRNVCNERDAFLQC